MPAVIDTLNIMRGLIVTVHSTLSGFVQQLEDLSDSQIIRLRSVPPERLREMMRRVRQKGPPVPLVNALGRHLELPSPAYFQQH